MPDDAFPLKRFQRLGYRHAALNGQKGYHGVAVLSRLPFESFSVREFLRQNRLPAHVGRTRRARRAKDPITLHNFYVPAGGDEPDPEINPKFRHKLDFLDEMRNAPALRPAKAERVILVGDLNVAPLEHDVWSHKQMIKVVSHTPIECEKLEGLARSAGNWIDSMRVLTPEPEKLYTWWSYRAMDNWRAADRGRRLDHVWTSDALADLISKIKIAKDYRGAARPSDHVPVTATVEL